MHNTYTRISVHGFINWITLTKRPPETREHPALRKETGHSKTTLLALFLLLHSPPFHLALFLVPSPPPASSSSHDLVSFAETGYGD